MAYDEIYQTLAWWLEYSPMARETGVQSQVDSYQRLKNGTCPPCFTRSIIRYVSRVKWSNPGKGVAPFPTHWYSSYRKGSLRVTLDYSRHLYFMKKYFSIKTFSSKIGTQLEIILSISLKFTLDFFRSWHTSTHLPPLSHSFWLTNVLTVTN